jgi:tetratricopeptide (TPR) repeat protein
MPSFMRLRPFVNVVISALLCTGAALAQSGNDLSSPAQEQPPALIDPAGPSISLATSEVLFDFGVALNACGYDDGLADSEPVRMKVRQEVNQTLATSTAATADRDKLCVFFERHDFGNSARNVAQYVSLGLYLTPPPNLKLTVPQQSLPPDANGVLAVLPLLRSFVQDADLHATWVNNHAAYDKLVSLLHGPITQMTLNTDIYLKQPISTYTDRRFLIVVEPMLDPGDTNARVYGGDYVVVVSPSKDGSIHMRDVHHAYLHYEIEPLLYARANAIDRLQPFLNMVQNAPISFQDKSGIIPFVIECLIHAIEARTMNTGVPVYKIPANAPRSQMAANFRKRTAYLKQVAQVRQNYVDKSMLQGYILTEYFYRQLIAFERTPTSLSQSIGPMVYGMDVPSEIGRIKSLHLHFDAQAPSEVVENTLAAPDALDHAESLLMQNHPHAAAAIANQALASHTSSPDRAWYVLARASLLDGNVPDAVQDFHKTIGVSKNPRLVAWSHIYLGRIDDVNGDRNAALAQYKLALEFEDGSQDTIQAAQDGLAKPYRLPGEPPAPGASNSAPATGNPPAPKTKIKLPNPALPPQPE